MEDGAGIKAPNSMALNRETNRLGNALFTLKCCGFWLSNVAEGVMKWATGFHKESLELFEEADRSLMVRSQHSEWIKGRLRRTSHGWIGLAVARPSVCGNAASSVASVDSTVRNAAQGIGCFTGAHAAVLMPGAMGF